MLSLDYELLKYYSDAYDGMLEVGETSDFSIQP